MSDASDAETGRPSPSERTVFGHPVGLTNLFGVELWERFSFYGMLTILGYYLYYSVTDGGLGLPEETGVGLVGAYGGLVYLSAILGGWVADRLLGMERTVFYGGVTVILGHLALAVIPGLSGVGVGLTLVALGSGALKTNASALLGTMYSEGDARRDGGFTLFYLGVNLGSFIGPLINGLLQREWGFHAGFAAAAVGMTLGLAQYAVFRRNLGDAGRQPLNPLPREEVGRVIGVAVTALVVVAIVLVTGAVGVSNLPVATTVVVVFASIAYFALLLTSKKVRPVERSRVRAFIPLFLANAVFWSLFQQIFTVLAVYSDRRMDWSIFGWTAPSNWIGSVEPIWIITLSPLFALLWTKLGSRSPSTPHKFAAGVIGMGVAFLLFVPFAGSAGPSVPALAVLFILAVFAVSELLISPIGLAVTTQLAPDAFRAQMMALYFLSVAAGTAASGWLAGFYDPANEGAYFGITGMVAVFAGIILVVLTPWVSRNMADVH